VLVPPPPGCVSQGDTVDEAIELHLAGTAEDGEDIPSDDQPPVVATVEATVRAPAPA
jgi:predicted RNase H-like HicB family nuclease